MAKKPDELLDSNYDGIKEYDNDLPKWWRALFYITIIFGVVYVIYYQFGPGLSSEERLARQLEEIREHNVVAHKALKETTGDELSELVKNPERLAQGKAVFAAKCGVCHGANGEGLVGPNLTDEYWIHGSKITDIKMTIENGVLDKGMLAWKGVLSNDEIDNVSAYIYSLKNSNPANPKAPQGVKENG